MEIEFVNDTHSTAYQEFLGTDDFFKKYVEKNHYTRISKWNEGILYASPGNVLGIILSSEFETLEWKKSLFWVNENDDNFTLCVYKDSKVMDDTSLCERYWCIQNEYLKYISELTGRKDITVKYNNHNQLAIVEYGRWLFLIAPTYMEDKYIIEKNVIYFKESGSESLDDLW